MVKNETRMHYYAGAGREPANTKQKENDMEKNHTGFRKFGTMLDCSRNAVMSADSVKKWIDLTADLGYNALLLYTEDTYEISGQPYFGYMRGRYSQEELKELDSYALSKGMELIPCIQTLAHMNALVRWPAYAEHIDTDDIMLAGDPFVYDLIDQMFAMLSQCFTSRNINIGMDEAHMIGRGKYYDLHGDTDRTQLLVDHVQKVAQIGEKYGFTLTMWSDMFFRLAAGGEYYDANAPIDEKVKEQIPSNVQLVYWDYYSQDKAHYDGMISTHKKLDANTWFAGGLWCWSGFAPHNGFSMRCTDAALASCREYGVQDVFLTMWGDDGGECSKFALLPALFYSAELAKGNTDLTSIKEKFQEKYGIAFDSFLLLDLPGTPGSAEERIYNPDKYLLYNDCFTGLMDSTLAGDEGEKYAACAKQLAQVGKGTKWECLFATQQALCEVLAVKAGLGVKTRKAYAEKDKAALEEAMADYRTLLEKLEHFHKTYQKQWFAENKPHGFDVQDIRLGGLIMRVRSCLDRLADWQEGRISIIEELEENQLPVLGQQTQPGEPVEFNSWGRASTANVLIF